MRLNPGTFNAKVSDGDIRLLRVFCAVVGCGGFAAAESELELGLPSISRYIKDLETRLGVRLCRRGRVGFSLTDQGRQVYSSSLQLIADLERFESSIRSIHSDLTGTLNIGIIDTLITDSSLPMPEILRTYKKKHPFVEYSVITATSNVIEQAVLDGNLHAGMVIGRRHINQLDYRFLYRENCNMYCSEDHPLYDRPDIRLEDIHRCDYAGYTFLDDFDRFRSDGSLVKTAQVDSMEAVATLISTGCFLGTLPDHFVQSIWRLKKFRVILPEVFGFSTDIELVTRSGTSSPHVAALLDHLDSFPPAPQPEPRAKRLGTAGHEIGVV